MVRTSTSIIRTSYQVLVCTKISTKLVHIQKHGYESCGMYSFVLLACMIDVSARLASIVLDTWYK